MPLHINLLHEEQSKVVERKRDPLKLGVLGLLIIAMLFYALYVYKAAGSRRIADDKAELEAQWTKLEPQSKKAKDFETSVNSTVAASESVQKIINGRFYWGPLLGELATTPGSEIQLTSFDGSIGKEGEIGLKVSGVAAGKEPRAVAEKFRQKIEDQLQKSYAPVTSQFDTLENSETPLFLDGKAYSTANFSIGLNMSSKPKETVKKP